MDRIFLNAIFLFLKILYFLFMIFFCEISHVSAMVLHNYVIFIYKKLTGAIFNIRKEKKKKKTFILFISRGSRFHEQ